MDLYTSTMGKHFDLRIGVLCAQVDQRLAYNLPSFGLRKQVAYEMERVEDRTAEQEKALKRISNDITTYRAEPQFPVMMKVQEIGWMKLELRRNELVWRNAEGKLQRGFVQYAAKMEGSGFHRILIVPTGSKPLVIGINDIIRVTNIVVDTLFEVPYQETLLLMKTVTHIQESMRLVDHELEQLRSHMEKVGMDLYLTHQDVVSLSQQLDEKINQIMGMKHELRQLIDGY